MRLEDSLSRGMLPIEVPPCFSTASFAAIFSALPSAPQKYDASPTRFSLARAGGSRRNTEFPNPFTHLQVARACVEGWVPLQRMTARSPYSLSRPVRANKGRSIRPRLPIQSWSRELVGRMPGGRVTLKADISQFYPSIYTHAVDWAIRGKARAKASRTDGSLGSRLDKHLRNSRGQQTNGISIGPDTSWLIAEVMLGRVDGELADAFPSITARCARFGDDLTLYATSIDEAQQVLATYQGILQKYELDLNPTKVAIIDGLEPVEGRWIRTLRTHRYRDQTDRQLSADIVDLFDTAFEERQRFATHGILAYAIKRCNPFPGGTDSWPLFRDLVLASAGLDSSTLATVYDILIFAQAHGLEVHNERVTEILNVLVSQHARFNHGFEVSWLLMTLRDLQLPLDESSANEISSMADSFSLVLLRDLCENSSRLRATTDFEKATRAAEADGALSSSDWLLAYEFRHNGWARPKKWDGHPFWKSAHTHGVHFYSPRHRQRRRLHRWKPHFVPHWAYPAR